MQASVLAPCSLLNQCRNLFVRLLVVLLIAGHCTGIQAQSAVGFTVEVQVANQSSRERSRANRLAFDRVLRRQVETRVRVEPVQREELMRDPSLYVQRFRYRTFVPGSDSVLLATSSVRDGASPGAVIAITFPTDLAAVIQQQLIPVIEEPDALVIAPVIALVAVEQQDTQYIIGGDRGLRFQQRATELAAANNVQLQFPEITTEDLALINAADIFNADRDRINSYVSRFEGNELLTGAIYRLSPTTWQSDWSYTDPDQQTRSFGLSTVTLDEALVAAMTQISSGSSSGGSYLSGSYDASSGDNFESAGLAIRVENIKSLADYDNVLATLRQFDEGAMTESLEFDSIVFRVTEQGALRVRNSLLSNRSFEPISADQPGQELSFRYLAR